MAKHTNPKCRWVLAKGWGIYCDKPTWVHNGMRINTPYCEQHARQWSDLRATDLEASMGN